MAEKGDNAKQKTKKPSFFKGLKTEYKKITWPDKTSTAKQTTAVVVVATVLSLLIALLDFLIQYGVDWLTTI